MTLQVMHKRDVGFLKGDIITIFAAPFVQTREYFTGILFTL
ncbi:hypothetical protein FX988_01811 [Paraglaciecola mesophila]|uniref:Uncharacterized protein n=1 Tax=Paraglaciecola mesophila TaxID=197222 RepID=A0A857JKT1_9ALTE|nr:hypothetical protein FX988_01811 [Paraglaciecola mesophila]